VVVEGTQKIRDGALVTGIERESFASEEDPAGGKAHEASASPARIAQ
jgi:hypothetical protein